MTKKAKKQTKKNATTKITSKVPGKVTTKAASSDEHYDDCDYLAKNCMSDHLIMVEPKDEATHAYHLMKKHKIRHIPVVSEGKAVGIISDRDLNFLAYAKVKNLTCYDVMTKNPLSVDLETPVTKLISTMSTKRINSVLIHDQIGKIVGIFTSLDALKLLTNTFR